MDDSDLLDLLNNFEEMDDMDFDGEEFDEGGAFTHAQQKTGHEPSSGLQNMRQREKMESVLKIAAACRAAENQFEALMTMEKVDG